MSKRKPRGQHREGPPGPAPEEDRGAPSATPPAKNLPLLIAVTLLLAAWLAVLAYLAIRSQA